MTVTSDSPAADAGHDMSGYARHVELRDDGVPDLAGAPPILLPNQALIDGHDITALLRPLGHVDGPGARIESDSHGVITVELAIRSDSVEQVASTQAPHWPTLIITAPDGARIEPLLLKAEPGEALFEDVGGGYGRIRMFAGRVSIVPTGTGQVLGRKLLAEGRDGS
jgi:hypothetical protein